MFEKGIGQREFYDESKSEDDCKMIPDEEKYQIVGYEKSCAYDIVIELVPTPEPPTFLLLLLLLSLLLLHLLSP